MEYGDIVLASSKTGFVPNAIKWFTQSQFSHSLVTTPDILNIPMCIEAAGGGVDAKRFDTGYIQDTTQGYGVWKINVDQAIKDKALISLLNDLQIPYGKLQYAWFIWRRINKLFGRDIKGQNNWNTDGMICSQLCVAYIKACGLSHVLSGYGEGSIAPQDLEDIFNSHPELFEKTQSVRLTA